MVWLNGRLRHDGEAGAGAGAAAQAGQAARAPA